MALLVSDVKVIGFSDGTLKMDVLCHGKHWHEEEPSLLWV